MNARTLLATPFLLLGLAANAADEQDVTKLDPVEVTAEQRLEIAFREVQVGLERVRSERSEDADKIVCLKQKPTGSNISVINCATNSYWNRIRQASLQNGVMGLGGAGASAGNGVDKASDRVFSMTVSDFSKLQKRFGKLPEEHRKRI